MLRSDPGGLPIEAFDNIRARVFGVGIHVALQPVERYSHLSLDHLREAAERIVSHATETKASASTPAPQRRHNFGDTASRTMERRAGVW